MKIKINVSNIKLHGVTSLIISCSSCSTVILVYLDPEGLGFRINVFQTKVHIRTNPLQGLDCEATSEIVCIGTGGRKPETVAVHWAG